MLDPTFLSDWWRPTRGNIESWAYAKRWRIKRAISWCRHFFSAIVYLVYSGEGPIIVCHPVLGNGEESISLWGSQGVCSWPISVSSTYAPFGYINREHWVLPPLLCWWHTKLPLLLSFIFFLLLLTFYKLVTIKYLTGYL